MGMEFGKAAKTAAVFAIPWFVLTLILGMILGYVLFPYILPTFAGIEWIVSGLISVFLIWLIWLWQGIDVYLKSKVKGI